MPLGRPSGRVVLIGFGGFGREVLDVIDELNASREDQLEVVGVLDDKPPDSRMLADYEVEHLGAMSVLERLPADVGYLIGIGNPTVRGRIDSSVRSLARESPVLVHPSATVARNVEIGPGTIVCSHVSITNHIRIGRHVHVNLNCTVGHDAVLGDYVTMSPLVAVSGYVRLGDQVFVGTGVTINPQVSIGMGAVVGSGAAVLRDVDPGTTVVGVPAKPR